MSSESFPIKEKRIRIRFPFCRRCVIMHGYRVQCASARCFGRIHPHQIIQYPGIAKLVSRLVWERVAPPPSRKILFPQSIDTPAIQALPPQVEVVKKSP